MNDPQTNQSKGNILVIDDTPENLRLLVDTLGGEGYAVRPASSGKQAISGAERVPPDLVLLDVNMPEMNGYEVCKKLKQNARLKGVPIIFVSALDDTFDKVTAFDVGGVDYITKPFQIEEVLARVNTHLNLYRLQKERVRMIAELEERLEQVKLLSGMLPICTQCKKIRDDHGYWEKVETYIAKHADVYFTHSLCHECVEELYPELNEKD